MLVVVLVLLTVTLGFTRSYLAIEATAPEQGWMTYFESYHRTASRERRAILRRQLKVLHEIRKLNRPKEH